jgi:hypothetical protein
MNSRQFNGIFRPLVKSAWEMYCVKWGISPNKKDAYRLWYEQHLREATRNRITSTKDATAKECQHIIDYFKALLEGTQSKTIQIEGRWTEAQIGCFNDLAKAAYQAAQTSSKVPAFDPWIRSICQRNGYSESDSGALYFPNCKESFDRVMADLAVIANDEYWIRRTAAAAETRMRWQIKQFLIDLDYLDKRFVHTWDYVKGIYKQSATLPADINDCPAQTLQRILQMLDTHVRRICKDFDVRPMDLPTRAHPHPHLAIKETAHHLHIGHELDHCPPVAVHAAPPEEYDSVPF